MLLLRGIKDALKMSVIGVDDLLKKYYHHKHRTTLSNVQHGGFSSGITRKRALIGLEIEMLQALHRYYTRHMDKSSESGGGGGGGDDSSDQSKHSTLLLERDEERRTQLFDEVLSYGVKASPLERLKRGREQLSKIKLSEVKQRSVRPICFDRDVLSSADEKAR